MISVMMPKESWVAKWNEVRSCMPGVYAININMIDEDEMEAEHLARSKGNLGRSKELDDLDDFIAKDDEEL